MGEVLTETKTYSEADLEQLIREATREGAVLAVLHFDAHGPDRDGVRNSLVDFLTKLTRETGVLYGKGEVENAIEQEGVFSTFAEVRLLAADFSVLHGLCLKYGPVAMEILEPKDIRLSREQLHALLQDAAQSTQFYSNYILEKVLPAEDRERLHQHVQRRLDHVKKIVDEKAKPGAPPAEPKP